MLFKELLGSLGFRASVVSCLALVILPASVSAQAHWQPRPAPLVTADNEPWFRLGEPMIQSPPGPRGQQKIFVNEFHTVLRVGSGSPR